MEPKHSLETPFENIALSFSGGGFRAASFALGVLSYFNHLKIEESKVETPLLRKVSYMSSASGGTIATSMYALYNAEGKPFKEYYKKLFEVMRGDTLLKEVLHTLHDDNENWEKRKGKRRNLINAFAIVYDKVLFEGKTLSALKNLHHRPHLSEVCFNASELYRGLLFRQAVKMSSAVDDDDKEFVFGNFAINLNHTAAGQLKLGDILAASSCFPAGFEPIIFPDDFVIKGKLTSDYLINNLNIELQTSDFDELNFLFPQKEIEELRHIRKALLNDEYKLIFGKDYPKIGLMDGGITDNLGIDSLMKANMRRIEGKSSQKPFDFMLINDVANPFMDPYNLPQEPKSIFGKITFNWLIAIFAVLLTAGITTLVYSRISEPTLRTLGLTIVGTMVTTVSTIFFVLLICLSKYIRGSSAKEGGLHLDRNFGPAIVDKLLGTFRKTSLNVAVQMLKARISSVLILNNDIFLKRVRQLLNKSFFENDDWKYRIKGNRIYDLAFSNTHIKDMRNDPIKNLRIVAETAMNMSTTLWFDKTDSRDSQKQACLIATGQFTTCRNLRNYIQSLKGKDGPYKDLSIEQKQKIDFLKEQLDDDYIKFISDPFFLYNKLGPEYEIESFKAKSISDIPFPKNFEGLL